MASKSSTPGPSGTPVDGIKSDDGYSGRTTVKAHNKASIETTLPVWLYMSQCDKTKLGSIIKTHKVDYNVKACGNEKVKIYLTSTDQSRENATDNALTNLNMCIEKTTKKKPVMRDVTRMQGAKDYTPSKQTRCYISISPAERIYLVGLDKKSLDQVQEEMKTPKVIESKLQADGSPRDNQKTQIEAGNYDGDTPEAEEEEEENIGAASTVEITKCKRQGSTLFVDRYLWLYMDRVCVQQVNEAVTPYKKLTLLTEKRAKIRLEPSNERSEKNLTKLHSLVSECERYVEHHVVTVTGLQLHRRADEIAKKSKAAYVHRERKQLHIITTTDQIIPIQDKIYQRLSEHQGKGEDSPSQYTPGGGKQSAPHVNIAPGQQTQSRAPIRRAEFHWGEKTTISIYTADITKQAVDVIVNAANARLSHGGGIAKAIASAAGVELQIACRELVNTEGRLDVGENYVTKGYNLPCRQVIHAVGPKWRLYENKADCEAELRRTITGCLQEAVKQGAQSIAIPAISSGIFGVPVDTVARQMYLAVTDYLYQTPETSLTHIHLIDFNKGYLAGVQREFSSSAATVPGPGLYATSDRDSSSPGDSRSEGERSSMLDGSIANSMDIIIPGLGDDNDSETSQ